MKGSNRLPSGAHDSAHCLPTTSQISEEIMTTPPAQRSIVIDPKADTIIILKHQDIEVATWDDAAEFPRPPFVLPDALDEEHTTAVTDTHEVDDVESEDFNIKEGTSEVDGENETRFHVSSRHLSLASTYFHRNLSDKWDQHERDENGRVLSIQVGWSTDAFARLMCIIHGKTRAVARTLELEEVAEMAHMVDYYDCTEVVEPYSAVWIRHLKENKVVPREYGKDLVMWLCIAWIFCEEEIFKTTTWVAMLECRSEMQTMGLPVPEIVTSKSLTEQNQVTCILNTASGNRKAPSRDCGPYH